MVFDILPYKDDFKNLIENFTIVSQQVKDFSNVSDLVSKVDNAISKCDQLSYHEQETIRKMIIRPESFDFDQFHNTIIDVARSPTLINDEFYFDTLVDLLYICNILKSQELKSVFDNLDAALQKEIKSLEPGSISAIDVIEHSEVLSRFGFLIFIAISQLVSRIDKMSALINQGSQRIRKSNKASSSGATNRNGENDSKALKKQRQELSSLITLHDNIYLCIKQLMKINLSNIFRAQTDLSTFIMQTILASLSISLKSEHLVREKNVKEISTRDILLECLCLCAKNQQQFDLLYRTIIHEIKFSDHLPEFMADVITKIVTEYDNSSLLDRVLNALLDLDQEPEKGLVHKHIAHFLIKLSEGIPLSLLSHVDTLKEFVGPSPVVRAALIDVYHNILQRVGTSSEIYDLHKGAIDVIFDFVMVRSYDMAFSVRQRCLQLFETMIKLEEHKVIPLKDYRLKWLALGVQLIEDKVSFIRKAALSLVSTLITHHPFNMDSKKLEWQFYWSHYVKFTEELKGKSPAVFHAQRLNELDEYQTENLLEDNSETEELIPSKVLQSFESETAVKHIFNDIDVDLPTDISNDEAKIVLERQYCRDACIFIGQLKKSIESACLLFYSKNKTDAVAAMNYFVVLDSYRVESSMTGIKQMIHLVWRNGSNEEDKKVLETLIECYKMIFFTPPDDAPPDEKFIYIAAQLIGLTYSSNAAYLISLERLVIEIYKENDTIIKQPVIDIMWHSFCNPRYPQEKRGAITIIAMLGSNNNKIIDSNLELLLEHGFDKSLTNIQATIWSCIALRKCILSTNKNLSDFKKKAFSIGIKKIKDLLLTYCENGEWYHLAEEALTTLYEIDSDGDKTSADILKEKAIQVFSNSEIGNNHKVIGISQFLFLLGHIGLKTIVYLEKSEAEFKKKKNDSDKKKNENEVELEMIGGSNEDDFAEVVQSIRDRELLFGKDSLLAKFVPLVLEIVSNKVQYPDRMLQRQATLCLAKFMCISPFFCETHLDLYLTISQKTDDTIIRGNMILGLGDMAVCFNNLIDVRRDELYKPLQDDDITVKRACLMTVTFLILAGQIKVKGQLAELSKLLVHEDADIKEMTKLFFFELGGKDNAIYNGFIDMIGGLMLDKNFDYKSFQYVVKYVIQFIKKEKHRHSLILKFDDRLKLCESKESWNRISFCLKELIKKEENGLGKEKQKNTEKESKKTEKYKEILNKIKEDFKLPSILQQQNLNDENITNENTATEGRNDSQSLIRNSMAGSESVGKNKAIENEIDIENKTKEGSDDEIVHNTKIEDEDEISLSANQAQKEADYESEKAANQFKEEDSDIEMGDSADEKPLEPRKVRNRLIRQKIASESEDEFSGNDEGYEAMDTSD